MGSYGPAVQHAPCANCGDRPGWMSRSEWDIGSAYVCSEACGKRLHQKIQAGMHPRIPRYNETTHRHCKRRIRRLRNRIKLLEHRLEAARD